MRRETGWAADGGSRLIPSHSLGLPRLSERLLEVGRQFTGDDHDPDSVNQAVALAAMAWNISVARKLGMDTGLGKMLAGKGLSFFERLAARRMLMDLARRKEETFSDDDRLVANWDVSVREGKAHVQVASLIYPDRLSPEVRQRASL